MKWLAFIISSLPAALLGIICGGYIGKCQIKWFRLAEANGTQYFTVIAWAFYGGNIGLVVCLHRRITRNAESQTLSEFDAWRLILRLLRRA